jgi:putative hydrolase of the HAD superfamily
MTTSRTSLLRKKWPLLALVLAAILALILVIWQLQTSPETNDAYVYADTIDVVPEVSGRIVEMGKELLEMPIRLLGGVTEALETLKDDYKLVVATKGDLLDQERKLQRSGISHYFDHMEIMTDKAPQDYQRLISSLDVAPQSFLMVGNSLKSDVLPVLSLGGHAIHVPAEAMWKHEVISGTEREYLMIHSLAELPAVLRG